MTTTIAGPRIQTPATIKGFLNFEYGPSGAVLSADLTPDAASFFHSLQQTAFNLTRSGPTASRPTSKLEGRWIGMPFFDTSLGAHGKPIWLASVNPDVWIDATSAVV